MTRTTARAVRPRRGTPTTIVAPCVLLLVPAGVPRAGAGAEPWPTGVLLTNDNGIDDVGLVELARAFSRVPGLQVVVVAPDRDRSGSSNYLGATREGVYRAERRNLGPGIRARALHGYPADCVIFALTGPLRDRPPDVLVSGIDGGPNMADDWFGSGTIGAARAGAYFGVPSVAVSGVEDDGPAAPEAVTSWVVRFLRSSVVRSLEIRGVRIVERARGVTRGTSRRIDGGGGEAGVERWRLRLEISPQEAAARTDVRAVEAGFIAVVPMRANEFDPSLAERLRRISREMPSWVGGGGVEGDRGERSPWGADRPDPSGIRRP